MTGVVIAGVICALALWKSWQPGWRGDAWTCVAGAAFVAMVTLLAGLGR